MRALKNHLMEEINLEGTVYLTVAYLGMIAGLALWTWTVVVRSRSIEQRLEAVEASIGLDATQADDVAEQSVAKSTDDATV